MIDLKSIHAVALDVAGSGESYQIQDDLTDLIWSLLTRDYQVYLFSTEKGDGLAAEDFSHPRLVFLTDEMPPSQRDTGLHPDLCHPHTLWVTDDAGLQHWIEETKMPFIYQQHNHSGNAAAMRINRFSELGRLLDPTGLVLADLVQMVSDIRHSREPGPLLIGISGPPMSGFQQFAIDLRNRLQDSGYELVELMDFSHLLASTEILLEQDAGSRQPWVNPQVESWVRERLLQPLAGREEVYLESPAPELPADFHAHFPFFLSRESILILFSELLFIPIVTEMLDLSVLLEVSDEEVTRRLYEIPAGERFDPKFTEQFLMREGKVYGDYLTNHRVVEQATLRVDANREQAFVLKSDKPERLI